MENKCKIIFKCTKRGSDVYNSCTFKDTLKLVCPHRTDNYECTNEQAIAAATYKVQTGR